jgi:two-component system, chemotaxis family, chemotaxis protein CheY
MICHSSSQGSGTPSSQSIGEYSSFYELAEVLVCDPIAANRAATRSALYSLGCRHIEIVGNLQDFSEALEYRPPDVAFCEAQVGEAELCRAIRGLRRDPECYNPFALIIVTAWTRNAAIATQILDAGADGLLLRPFSAALLHQKFRTHVLQRKNFVIAESYIGPERRATAHPSSSLSLAPPNSLKMKIEGRADIDETVRLFNCELKAARKILADAMQR